MLDKSTVYNILAEGMYFWTKAHQILTFWTFHRLSEVFQIPVIFETTFCIPKFASFCNILAKT